jgi:[ribosomal protein S18]-alanine N-acetyltransferase
MLAGGVFRQTARIDEIEIRPLVAADLDILFGERSRPFGESWLAAQEQGDVSVAVAVVNGRPVGRATLVFNGYDKRASLCAGTVQPQFQSRGVGSRMLEHLEEVARRRGCAEVVLAVAKVNRRAQRLYERHGYVRWREDVLRWNEVAGGQTVDVLEDVWVMQKQL